MTTSTRIAVSGTNSTVEHRRFVRRTDGKADAARRLRQHVRHLGSSESSSPFRPRDADGLRPRSSIGNASVEQQST
jgi:hypothetical protein